MYNGFIVQDNMRNERKYDGVTLKFGITVENKHYIVKLMKYSETSVFSEYIASRFIQKLGIPCHNVWLGYYNKSLVNIIEDFTAENEHLKTYQSTDQSYEYTDVTTKIYTYIDVMNMIEKHRKLSDSNKQKALKQFWDMFICDAILGNRDRHYGNWGYISNGVEHRPAPIFDNGSSLFPGVYKHIALFSLDKLQFINDRVERFPASMFQIYSLTEGRARKTNYYDILGDLRFNRILAKEVKQLKEKVGFSGVYQTIYSTVAEISNYLMKEYAEFYIYVVCVRYLHIIERRDIKSAFKLVEKRLNDATHG